MTHALLDADLVAFRCAASAEQEDEATACWRAQRLIEQIILDTNGSGYSLYLTGRNNFRKTIDPQYKANRIGKEPPRHLQAIREFLVANWGAEVCTGYEADDALGMAQTHDTVICSLDKDLLQVPGQHYNWVKQEKLTVTSDDGLKAFYAQTLIGDRSDNIIGVAGIGKVKAEKLLSSLLPNEYYDACRHLYNDDERYHRNCQLLWIWREPNGTWQPPLHDRSTHSPEREEDLPLSCIGFPIDSDADCQTGSADSKDYPSITTEQET